MVPERLLRTGFPFRDPELEPALRHMLGRTEGE
jgi:NAD dependent epimerase/dehydratase family enzyme